MCFYLGIITTSVATAIAAQIWRKQHQRGNAVLACNDSAIYILLVFCSLLPYCLAMGLRYGIGTDYFYTYVPTFEKAIDGTYTLEIGFQLLMRFVLLFTKEPTGLFLLCACVIVGMTGKAIWEYSAIPWVSILLFAVDRHFFISMNGMRQYMSLAVAIGGFRYIREKCFWKYALVVLAASLFHASILIFLPLGLFMYFKINPVVGGGLVAIFSLLRIPITKAISWAVSFTPYARYYEEGKWLADAPYLHEVAYLLVITVFASALYWRNKDDAEYQFLYKLELILLYISLNPSIVILADRIRWSLEFFHLLLIPKMILSCKKTSMRCMVGTLCVGACAAVCIYEIFILRWHRVYPYQSIFHIMQHSMV